MVQLVPPLVAGKGVKITRQAQKVKNRATTLAVFIKYGLALEITAGTSVVHRWASHFYMEIQ